MPVMWELFEWLSNGRQSGLLEAKGRHRWRLRGARRPSLFAQSSGGGVSPTPETMAGRVLKWVRRGIDHADMRRYLEFIGNIGLFALTAVRRMLVPPLELQMTLQQI